MKTYKIFYGNTKINSHIDYVCFHADTAGNAIEQFLSWEQNTSGLFWTYNISAIIKIEEIQ